MYFIVNPLDIIHDVSPLESTLNIEGKEGWYVLDTDTGHVEYTDSSTIMGYPKEKLGFDKPMFLTAGMRGYSGRLNVGSVVKDIDTTEMTFNIAGTEWKIYQSMGVVYANDVILVESLYLWVSLQLAYMFLDGDYVVARVAVRGSQTRSWVSVIFRSDGSFEGVSIITGDNLTLRHRNDSVYIARKLLSGVKVAY